MGPPLAAAGEVGTLRNQRARGAAHRWARGCRP